ncbi:MAG: methyltransferase [Clostridia bacterium]|nr:methyltransferase [Clostridia bacterium]
MSFERTKTDEKPVESGLFADINALLREGERVDDLQFKGLRLIQSPAAFCFGTDSVLLTHFALCALARAKRCARIVDMGSGSGAISLLLAAKTGLCVTAVEIDEDQCERFSRTLALNGIGSDGAENGIGGIKIVCADYLSGELKIEQKFDHAVCNPPYFKLGSGGSPKHSGATHEESADIFSIAEAARRLLKYGGSFSLCFPAERLAEALTALSVNALEPKTLRLVRTKAGKKPYLALIRSKHGAKPGLTVEDELTVLDEDGKYTPEVQRYYNGK